MRVASRHMPKYRARKLGMLGSVALLALLAGAVLWTGSVITSYPLPALTIAALLVALGFVGKRRQEKWVASLHQKASGRTGSSICEFAREFDLREVDPWVVRAVYEQVQASLASTIEQFPVQAGDLLDTDLGIDNDELDMGLAVEIEERTGRTLKGSEANPFSGRVKTVRDLVLFFNAQPKCSAT